MPKLVLLLYVLLQLWSGGCVCTFMGILRTSATFITPSAQLHTRNSDVILLNGRFELDAICNFLLRETQEVLEYISSIKLIEDIQMYMDFLLEWKPI